MRNETNRTAWQRRSKRAIDYGNDPHEEDERLLSLEAASAGIRITLYVNAPWPN